METDLEKTISVLRKRDYRFLGKFLGIAVAAHTLHDQASSYPLIINWLCRTYDEYVKIPKEGGE